MRIRAGVVLIEDDKVALIERYRDGNHYFVYPGGGADEGESPAEAAVREMEEETGLIVRVVRELIVIHFGLSTQHYFLVERLAGEYGTGTGEEFTDADPDNPNEGIYIPVWMPLAELGAHENIYPIAVTEVVMAGAKRGWSDAPLEVHDKGDKK